MPHNPSEPLDVRTIHTLAKLAFIAAATLYVITGNSNHGVRQFARAGFGLTFALEAVRLMNWLFPY